MNFLKPKFLKFAMISGTGSAGVWSTESNEMVGSSLESLAAETEGLEKIEEENGESNCRFFLKLRRIHFLSIQMGLTKGCLLCFRENKIR